MNWIKNSFGIKNFVILISVVCVIAGLLAGPSISRMIKRRQYQAYTEAKVTNMVERKSSFQHLNGTNIKIVGYELTFLYKPEGDNFSQTLFIKPGSEARQLYNKFESRQHCAIELRYVADNPAECMISNLLVKE
ncbi:MAG: hypothetical protein V1783_03205 [Bacteroidota bacterium]